MQIGAATVENIVHRFIKKLEMEFLYDPVVVLLRIFPKKPETLNQKNTWSSVFIAV